jgi:hypothetical protein
MGGIDGQTLNIPAFAGNLQAAWQRGAAHFRHLVRKTQFHWALTKCHSGQSSPLTLGLDVKVKGVAGQTGIGRGGGFS